MNDLEGSVDRIAAETAFSGVVRVDRGGGIEFVKAYGLAHRGWQIPNEVDTRFGIASGTKGLTALTVMSLIEEGRLTLETSASPLSVAQITYPRKIKIPGTDWPMSPRSVN